MLWTVALVIFGGSVAIGLLGTIAATAFVVRGGVAPARERTGTITALWFGWLCASIILLAILYGIRLLIT